MKTLIAIAVCAACGLLIVTPVIKTINGELAKVETALKMKK